MLWSYVQPMVLFAMYYFVLGLLVGLGDRTELFAIHVFAAMVFVNYFTETFTAGTRSIVRNKAIVQKMAMPREMFPVASMIVSAYHTVPQIVILTVACFYVGWEPDGIGFAAGLLGFAIIAVFGTALALLFSAANVFFRDFSNVVQTLTNFIRFGVPMIYPFTLVPERFGERFVDLYLANPIAEAVLLMQRCFWSTATENPAETARVHFPDDLFPRGLVLFGVSLLVLGLAQLVFTKLEKKFPERL
jgi:ABC-2 type transport system permease protein